MTPAMLTTIALAVMEFRDWLLEEEGESLDIAILERTIDLLGLQRQRLTMEGAR